MQYAQPWLNASNKPAVEFGNALEMQYICFEFKCHPTWWSEYHNESIHHENSDSLKDWRNDAYSYHFTLPTPKEFLSEENLLNSNSMFSEMGKNVLMKAGRLKPNWIIMQPATWSDYATNLCIK